jgi:hypothetical protein
MTEEKILPFNPLDKKNLGESVAQALLDQPPVRLSDVQKFRGAGVYAIYYSGKFPAYRPLAEANAEGRLAAPIYVGKAVPAGARKGGDLEADPKHALYDRLQDHAKSIEQVENLALKEFYCRYLVVDDIWIPLGETLLIARFSPLWNKLIDGFGNHHPGSGRFEGLRPRWDVLHPGRPWATLCKVRHETAAQIENEALDFLRNNPPPSTHG